MGLIKRVPTSNLVFRQLESDAIPEIAFAPSSVTYHNQGTVVTEQVGSPKKGKTFSTHSEATPSTSGTQRKRRQLSSSSDETLVSDSYSEHDSTDNENVDSENDDQNMKSQDNADSSKVKTFFKEILIPQT